MLVSAGNDDMIDSIVMIFDSPGGVAMGVSEVGTTIANINAKKPVVSYVDGLCCSAAYWLASQSSGIYATQSAEVGSIGAYMAVLDRTRQLEEEGIKVDMFRSGKHKGMGYPGTRLSDEQRTMLQDRIDGLGKDFKQAVRSGRGKNISDEVMQGQSFSADAAIRHALIDNIADFATAIRDAGALGKQKLSRRGKTV
jgi:protease-4